MADAPMCGMAITEWVFPAMSTETQPPYSFGSIGSGNYTTTFYINGSAPIVDPTVVFDVTP